MRRTQWRAIPALIISLMLSACGANYHSIYRYQKLPEKEASLVAIDAKQRVILVGNAHSTDKGPNIASTAKNNSGEVGVIPDPDIRRFCAEPSPDVFSVVAQALSGSGSLGKTADPKALEVALNAAFSTSEQASSIPRTQTVNMLRELMYRTCERYLSGGISDLELPLQAIRDQRLIVSILAIEQLTGAIAPRPVTVNMGADAKSGVSQGDAVVRIDSAYKESIAKKDQLKKRQDEYDKLNGESKDCDTVAKAIKEGKETDLSEELKGKKQSCEATSSALAVAKNESSAAAKHYETLTGVSKGAGSPVSVTVSPGSVAAGGIDRASSESASTVANVVKEIVKYNFQQDEFLFLCLKILAPLSEKDKNALISSVEGTCIDYVKSGIELQENLNLEAADSFRKQRQATVDDLFEKFWARVADATGKTVDPNKKKTVLGLISENKSCFDGGGTSTHYSDCFKKLRSGSQRKLAGKG